MKNVKNVKNVREPPEKFTTLQKQIFKVLSTLDTEKFSVAKIYANQWNMINYFIIGGIGVLINFLVNWMFIQSLPWYISNAIAILVAMSWNWINSVGPFCEYWGYTKNE